MALFSELVSGAQWRADLQNINRVTTAEWASLVHEAIQAVWHAASSARPDFQFKSFDVTLVSGASVSFLVPPDFYDEIDLVYGPDTQGEYSLGPFAWQNRRAPGAWWPPFTVNSAIGGTRARLMGQSMYIEPALRSGGPYRLFYCPRARSPRFVVRLATTASVPGTASGSGVGKTITEAGPGALVVDGVNAAVGDRVLLKNQASAVDNGVYSVTAAGDVGNPYVLTRAADFSVAATNGVYAGVTVAVDSGGTVNAGAFFDLLTFGSTGFGTIDVDTQTWGASNGSDLVLQPFEELIKIKAAIPAIMRDDRDPSGWAATAESLEEELTSFFRQVRTSNVPSKMVDTDQMGPRTFPWGGGW